ncbi:MAG TPA: DUF4340 domain-containing protein [Steroidobacteraceae bacterium]|jgi:hypothetical protein
MNQRRMGFLFVAALLVIGVAVWLSLAKRPQSNETLAGKPVLEGLKPVLNEVTEIRISKGDATRATLHKRDADWSVIEREYPADSGKVRKLLLDLGALEVVEEKTSDPASYARIGVEDVKSPQAGGTLVEVVTPKKVFGLIVGRTGDGRSAYVRVNGAKASALASPQVTPEADPKRWLDHALVDIPESRVKEVAVRPASGPAYSISRDKKEQNDFTVSNVPKGRELTSPGVGNAAAGDLTSFQLDDVRHAPADAKAAASATFRTFDGLEVKVDGFLDGDRHLVALTPSSTAKETEAEAQSLSARAKGWQFEVPAYKYDAMFRPLEQLLKQPEPKPEKKADPKAPAKKTGQKPAQKPTATPAEPASSN